MKLEPLPNQQVLNFYPQKPNKTDYSEFQAHIITMFAEVWPHVPKTENERQRIRHKAPIRNRMIEQERYSEILRTKDKSELQESKQRREQKKK